VSFFLFVKRVLDLAGTRNIPSACDEPAFGGIGRVAHDIRGECNMFSGDAGFLSDPPVLTVKENRTHCEACGAKLEPNVMHKCAGNEEWKPQTITSQDVGSIDDVLGVAK